MSHLNVLLLAVASDKPLDSYSVNVLHRLGIPIAARTVTIKRDNYSAQFGPDIKSLMKDIERLILDGRYILTDEVEVVELAFATYLHTSYVTGVGSGTDAIIIALLALGIKPGDEVITQANTFHATVAAIKIAGPIGRDCSKAPVSSADSVSLRRHSANPSV